MKKMTCSDMGGPCDTEMVADSMDEMIAKGMTHLEESHPEMAEQVKANSPEENAAWGEEFAKKWEAKEDMAEDSEESSSNEEVA